MYHIFKLIAAATLGALAAGLAQETRVRAREMDTAYGVLNRAGVEARLRRLRGAVDVLFIDLDHMHDLNGELGYAEVDRRIRQALELRRRDVLIGRWYSGDELVVIATAGDGAGLAERLSARMAAVGLSATIALVSASPRHAIETAMRHVQTAKADGIRGQVLRCS